MALPVPITQPLQPISILFNAASLLGFSAQPRQVVLDVLNVVGKLWIDATMHEMHGAELEISEHPVEVGADVTDHIRVKPRTLQIEAVITDSPIDENLLRSVISNASQATGAVLAASQFFQATVLGNKAALARSQEAYNTLQRLVDSRQTIDIDTPLRYWKSLAIERLQVVRDPKTGAALSFAASFREIIRVSTKTVTLPSSSPAAGAVKMGQQNTEPASASVKARTSSIAEDLFGKAFDSAGLPQPAVLPGKRPPR